MVFLDDWQWNVKIAARCLGRSEHSQRASQLDFKKAGGAEPEALAAVLKTALQA